MHFHFAAKQNHTSPYFSHRALRRAGGIARSKNSPNRGEAHKYQAVVTPDPIFKSHFCRELLHRVPRDHIHAPGQNQTVDFGGRLCLTGLSMEKYAVLVDRISFVILSKLSPRSPFGDNTAAMVICDRMNGLSAPQGRPSGVSRVCNSWELPVAQVRGS